LNFTSAKSGSMPVVSQSMTRPMVPVGATTVTCALRIAVLLAERERASQAARLARFAQAAGAVRAFAAWSSGTGGDREPS
jgi:hypothetical protein